MDDAMEVTAEGSLSPFQGRLSPESPERSSQRVQSSEESTLQTPGMAETLKNAMDLVESKISCHLHKARLLGSCPIKTCNMHYSPSTSHSNSKLNSLSKQNPLKRATAEDRFSTSL
ncbi:hypothetical protein CEXT_709411 [Caerostris extrusa]|uniref:Uncharacterized protein n=1 Tax=Caerostris extrusa TaxID=172846 RepID=A0AAV4MRF0_CAEEX|nr:hypothetical protein CEXT_709411 [Caerostris extrusa]